MNGAPDDPPARDAAGPIDLSTWPPFRLGPLEVRPPTREVRDASGVLQVIEPRVMQVIVALAQTPGAVVSRDTLIARCWDGRIVGDDAINRAVGKARLVADFARPAAFAIESIPRVGYRLLPAAPANSERPAVAVTTDASPLVQAGGPARRNLLIAGLAAGGAVAVGGGIVGYRALVGRPKGSPLVAVLPFDNLSSDRDLGYFADGLSEDILNALGQGGDMRVMARSSSFTLRGAAKTQAAQALGADYLLDGSVLRDGQKLRVNAHLSDAKRGEVIWSERFDRTLTQSLQLEDEIAQQVAGALRVKIASRVQQLIDPAIYELYLKGRVAMRAPDRPTLEAGDQMLREVVRRAPRFAPAWLELAKTAWRDAYLYPEAVQDQRFAFGKQAADQVIALDPHNGPAVAMRAQMSQWFNNWAEWETGQTEGLKLSPNDPELLTWRGWFCFNTGRLGLAVDFFTRAQTLDPLYYWTNQLLFDALYHADLRARAEATWTRNATLWPQFTGAWERFWLLASSGREREAAAVFETPPAPPGSVRAVYAQAMRASVGSEPERAAATTALVQIAGQGLRVASEAMNLVARLGADDRALALARSVYLGDPTIPLNRAIDNPDGYTYPQHGQAFSYYLFHPFLKTLRQAGRLQPVFDGIGLTDFWRTAGPPDA